MTLLRLAKVETMRLLSRPRLWVLLIILASAGALFAIHTVGADRDTLFALGAGVGLKPFGYATGVIFNQLPRLQYLLCLALPFVVCDTFASDRSTRYLGLLMTRGAPRWGLVASRTLANAIVSLVVVSVVSVVVVATSLLAAEQIHGEIGRISLFLPRLLDTTPALYFAIVFGTLVPICAGVTAIGVLAGVVWRSWLVAVLAPPIVVLMSYVLPLPASLVPFSPGARALYLDRVAPWATPGSTALYWVVVFVLLTAVAIIVYRRKEDL
jgi:ABC-type transport system involved in multi-copper enzyme maturation permease subunit